MNLSTSPSATLGKTPLLHLLASMADRQMSGTLAFAAPDGVDGAVFFDQGTPRKVAAAAPNCRLSDLLIEFGWLDSQSAQDSYTAALDQQVRHGRVLVGYKLLDESGLSHVLSHQLVRKLGWVSARPPHTTLGIHENVDLLRSVPVVPGQQTSLQILWAVAKAHVDEQSKRVVLERVARRPLRLHPLSDPERFGFDGPELQLLDRLRHAPADVESLLYQAELPRHAAEAMLYVLLLTRHIDLGDSRQPVGVPARSRPPVYAGSGAYAAAERHHFRHPGTPEPTATATGIERGSFRPSEVPKGGPTHQTNRFLATEAIRRAEQLLRRDRLEQAEAEARHARELDANNPAVVALHSWIRACLTSNAEDLERILKDLNAALDLDPVSVKTRFYRSEILKRLEHMEEAVAEWRLIIEIEPGHIEAQRELRLWQMRQTGRPPKQSASGTRPQVSLQPPPVGLFGRWFRNSR